MKKAIIFGLMLILIPLVSAISNVKHSVDGNEVTLTFDGTPPFLINIRPDTNIGQPGGYVWAKTNSDTFTIDLGFAINPANMFYYGVKDTDWSNVDNFRIGEVCSSPELTCRGTLIDGICFGDTQDDKTLETDEFRAELLISDRIAEINTPVNFTLRITNKESTTRQIIEGDCQDKPIDSICIVLPFSPYPSCDNRGNFNECIVSKNVPSSVGVGQTVDTTITIEFFDTLVETAGLYTSIKLPYTIPAGNSGLMRYYYRHIDDLKFLKSSIVVYDPDSVNNTNCDGNIIPEKIANNGVCCDGIFYPAADSCSKEESVLPFCKESGYENMQECLDSITHPTLKLDIEQQYLDYKFFEGLIFRARDDYTLSIGQKDMGVFFTYDQSYFESGGEGDPPVYSSLQEIKDFQEDVFIQVNDWLDKESIKYLGYGAIDYNYEPYYVEINFSEYPSGPTFDDVSPVMERLILELEQKTGVSMDNYDNVVLYLPSSLQTYLHGGGKGSNAFARNLYPTYNDIPGLFLRNFGMVNLADPKQNLRVLIHESLHPLGATDIYGAGEGTARKDFSLKFFNCIMGAGGFNEKIDHFSVCDYTAAEIGWMDLDCDGVPEALE
jgi:hypothetical protein